MNIKGDIVKKTTYLMNCVHFLQRKILIAAALLLSCGALQADFDPEQLDADISVLSSPAYKDLKANVTKYLTNSWCSAEKTNLLMDVVLLTRPEVCVEIGAFTGSSVLPVAATLKYLGHGKIFAVDAWSNAEVVKYLDNNDPNKAWWSQVNMNDVYNIFQKMIQTWDLGSYCIPCRNPSDKAVHQIGSIDFLHLDGDYSETGSLQDVSLYLPKVKSGGYVLLSNLFTMVNGKQPKMKAFCALFESCEMVAEIEHDNAVLFRKR